MTISLVVLMGSLGFVTDLGWGYYKQQSAQAAAEAAALSAAAYATANGSTCGVSGVNCTTTPTNCSGVSGTSAFLTACQYAAANGFTDGSNGANVTLTAGGAGSPPGSPGVTVNYWVSANVTQSLFSTFSAVLGNNSLNVGTAVTAASVAGPSGGTIYVLGSGSGTVTTNSSGSGAALNSGADIYVNSTSSSAVILKNTDSFSCSNGGKLHVCGSCQQHGGSISPSPDTGCANHPDPYANMQPPADDWSDWHDYHHGYGNDCDYPNDIDYNSGNHNLGPGRYCGHLNISGSASVTFSSGLYMMEDDFTINTSGTCSGSGTTFYMRTGQCSMTSGTVNLSAPTSGTWQGITIFQDRNNNNTCTLTCGSTQKISGVVYAPAATVQHCGGSNSSTPNQTIVCNKIQFTGSTNTHIGATTAYTCTPGVLVR
jgi:hypothetical protein